jgi:hypothetical protein
MFSHFDSLGVLHKAESCFLNKCGCRYSYESLSSIPQKPYYFTERYLDVKKVLVDTFYGPLFKRGSIQPIRSEYSLSHDKKCTQQVSLSLSLSLSLWHTHKFISTHMHADTRFHIHAHTPACSQKHIHMHDVYADTSIQAQVHACMHWHTCTYPHIGFSMVQCF